MVVSPALSGTLKFWGSQGRNDLGPFSSGFSRQNIIRRFTNTPRGDAVESCGKNKIFRACKEIIHH